MIECETKNASLLLKQEEAVSEVRETEREERREKRLKRGKQRTRFDSEVGCG